MEKHIPFEKLSKGKKRALNAQRRSSWGALSPVTRRPPNPKAYNRKKARKPQDDSGFRAFCCPGRPSLATRPRGW